MYEFYAFFNVNEVTQVFNAVAALMSTNDFMGLMRVFALAGLLVVVMAIFTNTIQWYGVPFFFIIMAVYLTVFLGKHTVTVIDRTGNQAPQTVANVPAALAWMASSSSHIGEYLTRATETVFSLPDDLKFQKNGMMFGSRLVQDARSVNVMNVDLRYDLMQYIRNCVNPDILDGYKSASIIRNSTNLWAELGDTNPGRWSVYNGGANTGACPSVYSNLTSRWGPEIAQNTAMLGQRMNYQLSSSSATALIQSQLADGFSTMLNMGNTAQEIIQQNMMINIMQDSEVAIPAMMNDPIAAQIALAKAQAQANMVVQYSTTGKIAEEALPKIRNVIELMILAMFPILFLFVIIGSWKGWMLLKHYLFALFWVQMWAPLYAVLNFVMTMSTSAKMKAEMVTSSGITLGNADALTSIALQNHHIAGMLTMAVPVIAWGIVKMGEIGGAAALGNLTSGAQSASAQSSGTASSGNNRVGTTSLATQSANSGSLNSYVADPTFMNNARRERGADGSEWTSFGDRSSIKAMSNDTGAISASRFTDMAQSQTLAASKQLQGAFAQKESAQASVTSAMANVLTNAKASVSASTLESSVGKSDASRFEKAHNQTQALLNSASDTYGISRDSAAKFAASASAGAGIPGMLSFNAGVSLSNEEASSRRAAFAADFKRTAGQNMSDMKAYGEAIQTNEGFRTAISGSQTNTAATSATLTSAMQTARAAESSVSEAQTAMNTAQMMSSFGQRLNMEALKLPENSGMVQQMDRALSIAAKQGGDSMAETLKNFEQPLIAAGVLARSNSLGAGDHAAHAGNEQAIFKGGGKTVEELAAIAGGRAPAAQNAQDRAGMQKPGAAPTASQGLQNAKVVHANNQVDVSTTVQKAQQDYADPANARMAGLANAPSPQSALLNGTKLNNLDPQPEKPKSNVDQIPR